MALTPKEISITRVNESGSGLETIRLDASSSVNTVIGINNQGDVFLTSSIDSSSFADSSSFVSVKSGSVERVRIDNGNVTSIKVSGSFFDRSTHIASAGVFLEDPQVTNPTASFSGLFYTQASNNPAMIIVSSDTIPNSKGGTSNIVSYMNFALNNGLDQTGFPITVEQNTYFLSSTNLKLANTSSANSLVDAPLVVSGGVAIGKNLIVSESITVDGNEVITSDITSSMTVLSSSYAITSSYALTSEDSVSNAKLLFYSSF